ncbi:MAG: ligase-associated DNA damage response DEXH box helicase [Saprospiraceae bacterium]
MKDTPGYKILLDWFYSKNQHPFPFQETAWQHFLNGKSGLLNAPTGCGKTFALFLPILIDWINQHPDWKDRKKNGLQMLWITPLRALARDIQKAMQEVCSEIGLPWEIGLRSGDTSSAERQRQKKQMPEILITTPESLHILLAQKGHPAVLRSLQAVVVDEWHDLLGSKRGVLVELALSRLKNIANRAATKQGLGSTLRVWGISATIGNLEEAQQVLLGNDHEKGVFVKTDMQKRTIVESILPDEIERFPWAGHLGIKLLDKVFPIIEKSRTTLIFTNTRSQSEIWYHTLLDAHPDLAGLLALHHSSIDRELRDWVENALSEGLLKAVVTTASLDLGVDFRPVDTVIQIGSPKGVARFLQRAGRSGHAPHDVSKIYFLPTHSLELAEAAALKQAIENQTVEQRQPYVMCFDVLVQYLCTLAVGEGFRPDEILEEVLSTHCFQYMTVDEWEWVLAFITTGGSLNAYEEFQKVEKGADGTWRIASKRTAMRHRLHIGTIVSDAVMKVKYLKGGFIGTVEERFISKMKAGDVFSLAGRTLEFVQIKEMTVYVRRSKAKNAKVPSWLGGRIPLSSNLGETLRNVIQQAAQGDSDSIEIQALAPLFYLQSERSAIPSEGETLTEYIHTKDGHHLFVYPFEGRLVHEVMGALLAYRLSRKMPITFSIAMNDYGFELLSDQPIPLEEANLAALFTTENLFDDIQRSINSVEMARRKFRDIAVIAGLVFQGYPGKYKQDKHLQSSSSLIFDVFAEYDPDNLLLRQAYQEVFDFQLEEVRLRAALERISTGKILFHHPGKFTPFAFPIKVDSMRENLSSEKLAERVKRMQVQAG